MKTCPQLKKTLSSLKKENKKAKEELEEFKNTGKKENEQKVRKHTKKAHELQKQIEQELWPYFDPKYLESVEKKKNYLESVEKKKNYEEKQTLEGHENWVHTLQALPDGRIISGSGDNTIKIWDGERKR